MVGKIATQYLDGIADTLSKNRKLQNLTTPQWTTPNRIVLELPTMRLRDFSTLPHGTPTLLCAPYALHRATIADFAQGHSLVEALRRGALFRVFVTDWHSATPEMRNFSIDTYLADLNVAVDELEPPVDLIGLCQGGWMALLYAARFPEKVNRLVLAGAPVDIRAGQSHVSRLAADVPLSAFETIVRFGDGRVLGRHVLEFWTPGLGADETNRILQILPESEGSRDLERRFQEWNRTTIDLPGTYFLQVVRWLFKENQIAENRFVALGHQIALANIRNPVFLLAARDDKLVAVEQLFATARLVGTPKSAIQMTIEPCSHLGLFLGRKTLAGTWQRIARWLQEDIAIGLAS
ncbi:MAG TPA: alpha/beta fold hydrolase [Xanthobacteraceae bacterium]|nr:alpha/beta fold hydrolase [Xanthobacteraceae bacterium]